jgi:glycosyltransferase involved in cell wall biosynthesis
MRVVHVESGRHFYGGAAQVEYLLGGLNAARVDNVLVCAAGGELAARAAGLADVVALPMRGELDVAMLWRIGRVLRALRPDLVHVHSRRGADFYGGFAARRAGVPAVLTRRVDSAEPRAWGRLKYRPYARVVALSGVIHSQLAAAGVEDTRIVRIPSAVDSDRYRPDPSARGRVLAELGLPPDALLVGVVAQLIVRKRHALLLDALPAIVRAEPRVRVVLFGRGPLDSALRARVATHGLDAHVRFAGFRADLPALLPGLDVVVHPADREGLGVAVLEAASCGVPVVAAAAGGLVDAIEHGRTGLLFAPSDGAALARALLALLADPAERRRLGEHARAHVARRFGVAALAAAHLALYSAVAREAGRGESADTTAASGLASRAR